LYLDFTLAISIGIDKVPFWKRVSKQHMIVVIMDVFYYTNMEENQQIFLWKKTDRTSTKPADSLL
jgi:hypothetical protein